MKRFIEGSDRSQSALLRGCLDDRVDKSNSVPTVDVFVGALVLLELGFEDVNQRLPAGPATTPRRCADALYSFTPKSARAGWLTTASLRPSGLASRGVGGRRYGMTIARGY